MILCSVADVRLEVQALWDTSACRWQIVTAVVEMAAACILKVQEVYFLCRTIKHISCSFEVQIGFL